MPTVRESPRTAEARFVTTWDEAIALEKELRSINKSARQEFNADVRMVFVNPWGGLNHTEFLLFVEIAKGTTTVVAAELTKWLFRIGRDFLKRYRRKNKKPNAQHRANRKAKNKRPQQTKRKK